MKDDSIDSMRYAIKMLEEVKEKIIKYEEKKWNSLTDAEKILFGTASPTLNDWKYHMAEASEDFINDKIKEIKDKIHQQTMNETDKKEKQMSKYWLTYKVEYGSQYHHHRIYEFEHELPTDLELAEIQKNYGEIIFLQRLYEENNDEHITEEKSDTDKDTKDIHLTNTNAIIVEKCII